MIALLAVVLTTPALHAQCPTDAYVGYQAANGTDHFATIMDAYDAVCAGGTIHINSGIYAESIEIDDSNAKDGVTFLGDPAGSPIDYPIVTGGVRTTNSVNINGMTLQNMIVQGLATNANGVFDCDNSGLIVNLTLDGVTIDGEGMGWHGFLGQGLSGLVTVDGCTFEDIANWSVFDSDSGAGLGDAGLTGFVFTNNTLWYNDGGVGLRGHQDPNNLTATAIIEDNYVYYMNGVWSPCDYGAGYYCGWAGIEVNYVETVELNNNIVDDIIVNSWGEGQAFQVWKVNTLNMASNTVTNCYEGLRIYANVAGRPIPDGAVTGNSFSGNGYAIEVFGNADGDPPLNAACNWYGDATGPDAVGNPSAGDAVLGDVNYAPWDSSEHGACDGGDCNGNGTYDADDITAGTSEDCNGNSVPDECETADTDTYVGYAVADGVDNFDTIMEAYDAVCAGGTVHVAAGSYAGSIEISDTNAKDGITIVGEGNDTIAGTAITGGVRTTNSVDINGMTFTDMVLQGLAPDANGVFDMDNSGLIYDLTLDGVTVDGEGLSDRHGFLGQGMSGVVTVNGCTFENIANWAVFDSDSGGGLGDAGLTGFVFTNNTLWYNDGGVGLRGHQDPNNLTATAIIEDNYVYYMNGVWSPCDYGAGYYCGWAGIEVNYVETVELNNNIVDDIIVNSWGEGQAFQVWKVNNLNMTGNTTTLCYEGLRIYANAADRPIPAGAVTGNSFSGNGYAIEVFDPDDLNTDPPLNAPCNWYGDADGPNAVGNPSAGDAVLGDVNFAPWDSTEHGACDGGDCNGNGTYDADEIAAGTSEDCNGNSVPDECETDSDRDGDIDDCDDDDDNDGSLDADDSDDNNPNICSDTDDDGCDDCSGGSYDPANDGADFDGDGLCDAGDDDDDNDGALDGDDDDDNNANVCSDVDNDGCDDCSGGSYDPANDGTDTDSDGLCDTGDDDDDGDGIEDECDIDITGGPDCNDNGILDSCELTSGSATDSDNDGILDECEDFLRGDANGDNLVDISDGIFMLDELFLGGGSSTCEDAMDFNDDGGLDIADPVGALNYIFLQGAPPSAPFPSCGIDPTDLDPLDCDSYNCP